MRSWLVHLWWPGSSRTTGGPTCVGSAWENLWTASMDKYGIMGVVVMYRSSVSYTLILLQCLVVKLKSWTSWCSAQFKSCSRTSFRHFVDTVSRALSSQCHFLATANYNHRHTTTSTGFIWKQRIPPQIAVLMGCILSRPIFGQTQL